MATLPNIKIRPETKRKFLKLKEELEKQRGEKLSQDDVLSYLLSKAYKAFVNIEIEAETSTKLEKLRKKLEELTGNRYTFDDAINFLLYYFVDDPCCQQKEIGDEEKPLKEMLQRKKEFFTSFFGEQDTSPITYDEVATRVVYVPNKVFEKVRAKANGNPPLVFLLSAAEQGAEIYGRFLGVIGDDKLNVEVITFLNSLPTELKDKFIEETQKRFQTAVKETLKRFKKKAGKKTGKRG